MISRCAIACGASQIVLTSDMYAAPLTPSVPFLAARLALASLDPWVDEGLAHP